VRGLFTPKRLAVLLVCVVSLVGCCALAWWQWTRFSSASGTFQNLGYVLQWPLFGLFPAFMVWRMRRLEAQRRADAEEQESQQHGVGLHEDQPVVVNDEPVAAIRPVTPAQTPVTEEDDEHAAYNRWLAELNARDRTG
jgi:DNA-binding transcriptional regulator of glucitol operon